MTTGIVLTTLYDDITNSIIEKLNAGVKPWVKPWRADSSSDKNIVSNKAYTGINRLILGMTSIREGYSSNTWGSYKQWQEAGGNVKRGESGTKIIFFSNVEKSNKETGETENYALMKSYSVDRKSTRLNSSH